MLIIFREKIILARMYFIEKMINYSYVFARMEV